MEDFESIPPQQFAKEQREFHIESLNRLAQNLSAMSRLGDKLAERLRHSAEQLERGEVPEFKAGDVPKDEDNKQHTLLFIAHGEACGSLMHIVNGGIPDPFHENQQEFAAIVKAAKAARTNRPC